MLSTAATSSAAEAPRCASVFCTRGPNSRGARSNSATSTRAVLSLIGYLRFRANRASTSSFTARVRQAAVPQVSERAATLGANAVSVNSDMKRIVLHHGPTQGLGVLGD